MKTLTCRDLGGPCDHELRGSTFEEIGHASRAHVMNMIEHADAAHMEAADHMRRASPDEQRAMMAQFRNRFDDAPDE